MHQSNQFWKNLFSELDEQDLSRLLEGKDLLKSLREQDKKEEEDEKRLKDLDAEFYEHVVGKGWVKCDCGAYYEIGHGFNSHCSDTCHKRMTDKIAMKAKRYLKPVEDYQGDKLFDIVDEHGKKVE